MKRVAKEKKLVILDGSSNRNSSAILVLKYLSPKTKVIGVEPELAKDAYLSLKTGVL